MKEPEHKHAPLAGGEDGERILNVVLNERCFGCMFRVIMVRFMERLTAFDGFFFKWDHCAIEPIASGAIEFDPGVRGDSVEP